MVYVIDQKQKENCNGNICGSPIKRVSLARLDCKLRCPIYLERPPLFSKPCFQIQYIIIFEKWNTKLIIFINRSIHVHIGEEKVFFGYFNNRLGFSGTPAVGNLIIYLKYLFLIRWEKSGLFPILMVYLIKSWNIQDKNPDIKTIHPSSIRYCLLTQ